MLFVLQIRRCAQECLEKVLKSFQSSAVIKNASKLAKSLLMTYMPVAVTLSNTRSLDGSKEKLNTKPEQVEVLHMLNLLNLTIPYISVKVLSKLLSELCKLMSSEFSPLTRQIFKAIEGFFENSNDEVIIPEIKNIINSLTEYTSLGEKNPADTIMSAASLLKSALAKLHAVDSKSALSYVPIVCGSLRGMFLAHLLFVDSFACMSDFLGRLEIALCWNSLKIDTLIYHAAHNFNLPLLEFH